ncbi:MAG: glycosyltransferase [Candidatus Omnitrophica bacterium]|nr:glycosyltransferase [Candidatus Omnitrophota bacterium]
MKISIITVVHNNAEYIGDCIKSVIGQSYSAIEYIIVDGKSTDGTLEVVNQHKEKIAKIISEKDKGYVYAMNKGLEAATGDIVGFLHSDDFYAHERVIEEIVGMFKKTSTDSLYGDLVYVKKDNPNKIVRYWKGGAYNLNRIRWGWMPPHPTFFVKREIYEKHGYFNTDFKIAADYEIMLRFLYRHKISIHYMPEILVNMRTGGVSNKGFRNIMRKSFEDYKICKNYDAGKGFSAIILKNLTKIPQFFIKENKKAKR